jgi:hypothetical protein
MDKELSQETITENERRIARVLHLRHGRPLVRASTERELQKALIEAGRNPDRGAYREMENLIRSLRIPQHRKDMEVALGLLNRLWLLPADTQLELDVIQLIRERYVRCRHPSHHQVLRNALKDHLWSPYPIVRAGASKILQVERVSPEEIKHLDLTSPYSDVRIAVAERIFLHGQHEHIESLLEYLVNALQSQHLVDERERRTVHKLIPQLKDFPIEHILVRVFQQYLDFFDNLEVRGFLMAVLSSYGNSLVPSLLEFYQVNDSHHHSIIRLLRQMVSYGHVAAAPAFGKLVLECNDAHHLSSLSSAFLEGTRELATRGMTSYGSQEIRTYINELCAQLETSSLVQQRELAQKLQTIVWEHDLSPELIERVLAGKQSKEEWHILRKAGSKAFDLLATPAKSQERLEKERCKAVEAIQNLYGQKHLQRAFDLMWQIYTDEYSTEQLHCCALKALGSFKIEGSMDIRRQLAEDYRKGSPSLRKVIIDIWHQLFPCAPSPDSPHNM